MLKSELVAEAAELFKIHPRDLVGTARFDFLMPARFALCKALRLRGWTYQRIGNVMNRDHSTIMHAVRRADYMMERDADYAAKVRRISDLAHTVAIAN